jgi:hypothetical protein
MERIWFAFRYLAFFLQSPQYLCMWWNASGWEYYMPVGLFVWCQCRCLGICRIYGNKLRGPKSKWNGAMCHRIPFVSNPGRQDAESRTEITHLSTGVIATVASLSIWKTSGGFQSHFLPSQENVGSTTLPFVSNPEQETLDQLGTSPAAMAHGQGSIPSPQYSKTSI